MEIIEDPNERREGWFTDEIGPAESVRGFHGPLLLVREIEEEERFFVEALGFRKTGVDGVYHRLEVDSGGAGKTIIVLHEPARQKGFYEELGYTDCSEIKDRNYFHSIYVRSPGGIMAECAATAPGGFA